MATKKNTAEKVNVPTILPETKEMELFLSAGYPFSVEEAEEIIKARKTNPASYPYEVEKNARAFLEAYRSKPVAIDTEPGWKRYPNLEE